MGENRNNLWIVRKIFQPITNIIKNDFDDVPEIIATAKKRKNKCGTEKSNLVGTLKSSFLAVALSCAAFVYSFVNKNTTPTFFFGVLFILSFACTAVLYIRSYTSGKLTMQELQEGLWSKKTKGACKKAEADEAEDEYKKDV